MRPDDPEEIGDVYSLTAINPDTRLLISHVEGGRDTNNAIALFEDIESKRDKSTPLPVFTSDNWDAFDEALVTVYGKTEYPEYKGRGRKPHPVQVPARDLKYAQVCKKREKGHVVEVVQYVVYGDQDEVFELLCADTDGKINTSYVERLNLTVRNSSARFIRKGMNYSKDAEMHSKAVDFFQTWYNFVKPHLSLREETDHDEESDHHRRKWVERTPAMAQNLTDHIWTLKELMTYRVPVQ